MIPCPGCCCLARVAHWDLSPAPRGICSKSSPCCDTEPRGSPWLAPSLSPGHRARGTAPLLQPQLGSFPLSAIRSRKAGLEIAARAQGCGGTEREGG